MAMLSVKVSALAGAAVAALLTSVAGCAPAHQPAAGRQPSGSASPARSQVTSNAISAGSPSPPAGAPGPGRFAATSVTFVSADEAFVLGTAPCPNPPCTPRLPTLAPGGGRRGLPAPPVP